VCWLFNKPERSQRYIGYIRKYIEIVETEK